MAYSLFRVKPVTAYDGFCSSKTEARLLNCFWLFILECFQFNQFMSPITIKLWIEENFSIASKKFGRASFWSLETWFQLLLFNKNVNMHASVFGALGFISLFCAHANFSASITVFWLAFNKSSSIFGLKTIWTGFRVKEWQVRCTHLQSSLHP